MADHLIPKKNTKKEKICPAGVNTGDGEDPLKVVRQNRTRERGRGGGELTQKVRERY